MGQWGNVRLLRSWLLLAVGIAGCEFGGGALSGQTRPATAELLKQYEQGQYDDVAKALGGLRDFEGFRKELDRVASPWIASQGPAAAPRRRLVAASLALEAARVGVLDWFRARTLVEWGCAMLRKGGPPLAAERSWQLAAVALSQGAGDPAFLLPDPPVDRRRGSVWNHLAHAQERFPAEPRLQLAALVVHEHITGIPDEDRHPRLIDRNEALRMVVALEQRNEQPPSDIRMDRATTIEVYSRTARGQAPDPWREYLRADFRSWQELLSELRSQLKQ
jgi:hypothetical protein